MFQLSVQDIHPGQQAANKEEAIRQVAAALVQAGNVADGYVNGMLAREQQTSTFLGNGIAIPHGKLEEDTLRAVGVFVQLETPIAFDAIDNQPVDLLFAMLVPESECKIHLKTLALVAEKFNDKNFCRQLRLAESDEALYQQMING